MQEMIDSDYSWECDTSKYGKKLIDLDAREIEMAWSLMNTLSVLSQLDQDSALNVVYSEVPSILLPEIITRGYSYRIKESSNYIQILIFKKE